MQRTSVIVVHATFVQFGSMENFGAVKGRDYHLILKGAKPEDEVAAALLAPAIPGRADPVMPVVVSLLFKPVG
jgi:hypothetical protein